VVAVIDCLIVSTLTQQAGYMGPKAMVLLLMLGSALAAMLQKGRLALRPRNIALPWPCSLRA